MKRGRKRNRLTWVEVMNKGMLIREVIKWMNLNMIEWQKGINMADPDYEDPLLIPIELRFGVRLS